METTGPIVVGTDGSSGAQVALRWAAEEAAMHHAELKIIFALEHVEDYLPGVEHPLSRVQYENEAMATLAAGAEFAQSVLAGVGSVSTELRRGPAGSVLASASGEARMVVVGSRGHGALSRALLGSVGSVLTRNARCPVAVIPATTPDRAELDQKPVLVGVDGLGKSRQAIAVAMAEASLRGATVRAVNAWRALRGGVMNSSEWNLVMTTQRVRLAQSLAGFRDEFPDVKVERFVVADSPVRHLREHSRGAQLVVVGSRGRGPLARIVLGSASEAMRSNAECPVIVVRQN